LGVSREELYTHLHRPVKESEQKNLESSIQRRISGEPLQYILGHQEFWSIDFKVNPRVLIPRPDTELLVEQALSALSQCPSGGRAFVLEIGTGSGAVAISLAHELEELFVVATDISWEALSLAKENARGARVGPRVQFIVGDLFGPIPVSPGQEPFALILSNPPYISRSAIEALAKEVRDFEPRIALDGGQGGMDFYRRIIGEAPAYLRKGGWILLEVGQDQGQRVSELIDANGFFSKSELVRDLSGIQRVVKAQRKGDGKEIFHG
jgi:release factor glutamine methyltransferase